jgi:galacturan 1,4-alpha-galacturonidase
MRFSLCLLALLSRLPFSLGSQGHDDHGHDDPHASCILVAKGHGVDDSPHFLSAVQACSKVTIPSFTTLNISTRLNMTGLRNKHIVSKFSIFFGQKLDGLSRTSKGLYDFCRILRIGVM